jgi:hypothetical protein
MTFEPIPGVTVIGLGHRARHGKDTAAKAIISAMDERRARGQFAPTVERFSFADDLYAICRVLYGMTAKDAPLLQRVGVEYRDTKGVDVWVRSVYAKMQDARPMLAIVTDVRFPNEFAFIKALGGVTVRVSRVNPDGSLFVDPSRPATHISETALADAPWDVELTAANAAHLTSDAVALAERVMRQAQVA